MTLSAFAMRLSGYEAFSPAPKLFSLADIELSLPTPNGLFNIKQKGGKSRSAISVHIV